MLTQKERVRTGVTDKFNERFFHEQTHLRLWSQHVDSAVNGKHNRQLEDLDQLTDEVFPPKSW